MSIKPIPDGYHTITPYFVTKNSREFIEFLKKAFNAESVSMSESPDGKVMHAEIRIGDSMMMLSEASESYPAVNGLIYLYVNDTDAIYKQALEAGAESLMEPADQFYGDRNAGVKDTFGNTWWIGTHIENVSEEEIGKRHKEHQKKK